MNAPVTPRETLGLLSDIEASLPCATPDAWVAVAFNPISSPRS